jgi:hypothetical protein
MQSGENNDQSSFCFLSNEINCAAKPKDSLKLVPQEAGFEI